MDKNYENNDIEAGTNKGNIRELIAKRMEEEGSKCKCIRCREIGLKQIKKEVDLQKLDIDIKSIKYKSSDGIEYFISAEDKYSTAIIRELHVYGQVVPIGKRDNKSWQHKGIGAELMSEAEKIAKEELSMKKIVVISAIGTREYYKKLNYELEGPYMSKFTI